MIIILVTDRSSADARRSALKHWSDIQGSRQPSDQLPSAHAPQSARGRASWVFCRGHAESRECPEPLLWYQSFLRYLPRGKFDLQYGLTVCSADSANLKLQQDARSPWYEARRFLASGEFERAIQDGLPQANAVKDTLASVMLMAAFALLTACSFFTEPVRYDPIVEQDRLRTNAVWRVFVNDRPGWTEGLHSDRVNCREHAAEIAAQAKAQGLRVSFAVGTLGDNTPHVVAVVDGRDGTQFAFDNGRIAPYPFPPKELKHWMANLGWFTLLPEEGPSLAASD